MEITTDVFVVLVFRTTAPKLTASRNVRTARLVTSSKNAPTILRKEQFPACHEPPHKFRHSAHARTTSCLIPSSVSFISFVLPITHFTPLTIIPSSLASCRLIRYSYHLNHHMHPLVCHLSRPSPFIWPRLIPSCSVFIPLAHLSHSVGHRLSLYHPFLALFKHRIAHVFTHPSISVTRQMPRPSRSHSRFRPATPLHFHHRS